MIGLIAVCSVSGSDLWGGSHRVFGGCTDFSIPNSSVLVGAIIAASWEGGPMFAAGDGVDFLAIDLGGA